MTHQPPGEGFGEVEGWMTVDSDDDPETRLDHERLRQLSDLDHRERNFSVSALQPREDTDSQFWDLSHRHREVVGTVTRRIKVAAALLALGTLIFIGVRAAMSFQDTVGL